MISVNCNVPRRAQRSKGGGGGGGSQSILMRTVNLIPSPWFNGIPAVDANGNYIYATYQPSVTAQSGFVYTWYLSLAKLATVAEFGTFDDADLFEEDTTYHDWYLKANKIMLLNVSARCDGTNTQYFDLSDVSAAIQPCGYYVSTGSIDTQGIHGYSPGIAITEHVINRYGSSRSLTNPVGRFEITMGYLTDNPTSRISADPAYPTSIADVLLDPVL